MRGLGKRGHLDSPPIQFMSTWEDLFQPDTPIDIDRTALAVMYAVNICVGYDGHELSNTGKSNIVKEVSDLLKTYDSIRSQHISYLRDEVLRLHNLLPGATISVRNPDGNRSKPA